MELNERHRAFLNAVHIFGKSGRYHGMMPRWVADSCNEREVREAFALGCVAYSTIAPQDAPAFDGLILTDKGLAALETH